MLECKHFCVSSPEVVHLCKPRILTIRVGVVSSRCLNQIHRWGMELVRAGVHYVAGFEIKFENGEQELCAVLERG